MFKNTASQKVRLFAFDYTTGAPKTGDAANLTAYLSKDFGALTALTDTSATEISSTNAPGWYEFDVTQTESNCDDAHFTGKSSTANVTVVGARIRTYPATWTGLLDAAATRTAVGLASANLDTQLTTIDDFLDTEVAAIKAKTDQLTFGATNTLNASVTHWNGTAVATPATAGHPVVTLKVGTGTGEVNLSSGNVPIRTGLKKGASFIHHFTMQDDTGAPLTGSTVTVYYRRDSETSFTSLGTATEAASGHYFIASGTTSANADTVSFRHVGSGGSGTPVDGAATYIMEP